MCIRDSLWSEEYDEDEDVLRFEEDDVFPDDLFFSFYYYSLQILLLAIPLLDTSDEGEAKLLGLISANGRDVYKRQALGRAIKDRVFEETGLIISAGLAPNKFLAKLASDLDKPDGLVVIPYGKECESLANLPIKRIWGVGPSTERRLKDGGFTLIKDVQVLPDEKSLVPYVGNQARRIWELARGIDERPVEPDRQIQSVGNEEMCIRDSKKHCVKNG